jgi:hypothetical protein
MIVDDFKRSFNIYAIWFAALQITPKKTPFFGVVSENR